MTRRRPPTPEQLAAARDLLGVDADATRGEISAAWKQILRRTHPDAAADEQARPAAERVSAQVNEARDVLMADLDAPAPDRAPDRAAAAAAAQAAAGNGARPSAGPAVSSANQRGRVDDDVRAGRGILIGLIAFMAFALTAIVAVIIIAGGSTDSRVDNAESSPATDAEVAEDVSSDPRASDAVPPGGNTLGAELPSPTPEVGTQFLLFSVSTGNIDVLQYLVSPAARQDDLEQIFAVLNPAEAATATELRIAAYSIECIQTPGLKQALCDVTRPVNFLPRPLEWVETDGLWRLVGWGPTPT